MIYQFKVLSIAMLCGLTESGRPKCEQYWPELESELGPLPGFKVRTVEEEGGQPSLVVRKLEYEYKKSKSNVT